MDITSLQPAGSPSAASPQVSVQEAAQRRQLLQAAQSVNQSGVLGQNQQLVFALDRYTHHPVMRVVDRTTNQVITQIPPEYVLQLAQNLGSSAKVMVSNDDT